MIHFPAFMLRYSTAPWQTQCMNRRALLTGLSFTLALPRFARAADFSTFLAALQARAAAEGIPSSVIEAATGRLVPNQTVLRLDHHQPEFTETWAVYSSHVLNQTRIEAGARKSVEARDLFASVTSRFGVSAAPLLGIWGIETNYGATQGDFDVIDALTTLAWDRNSHYFGSEVISALRIIAGGDAPTRKLVGSYAGAMGQPQFMPSVYLSTAVSFSGEGQPDIWSSDADSIASIANYLAKAGWAAGGAIQRAGAGAAFAQCGDDRAGEHAHGRLLAAAGRGTPAGHAPLAGESCRRRCCCRTAPAARPSWCSEFPCDPPL